MSNLQFTNSRIDITTDAGLVLIFSNNQKTNKMKNLLLFAALFLTITCNAQLQADSIQIKDSANSLSEIKAFAEMEGVYVDSIICNVSSVNESNAYVVAKAAGVSIDKIKQVLKECKEVVIYYRKEIMIGE